jgi:aspartokinase-like uncharacterized kinase
MKRRVLKLGGSLLSDEAWVERFGRWLAGEDAAENVLVVGGGRLADCVREIDRVSPLDVTEAHWFCVAAMAINGRNVAQRLSVGITNVTALLASPQSAQVAVVDVWRFLTDEEPRLVAVPLPAAWEVTSDSIAARVAEVLRADELVLLKSCMPTHEDRRALAEACYVDPYFPHASAALRSVRYVNLRGV